MFYFDESGALNVARYNEYVNLGDKKWYCVLLILLLFNSLCVTTTTNCFVPL